jgi:hypothetical protein
VFHVPAPAALEANFAVVWLSGGEVEPRPTGGSGARRATALARRCSLLCFPDAGVGVGGLAVSTGRRAHHAAAAVVEAGKVVEARSVRDL